ncbi:MAG: exosome complex RNA-binding protein Csl4 [archaeon]|nr:exosome complex RNA-binding protein Csl4 [archaeon]
MSEKRRVFPGDKVAVEEEYLISEGTFARNGVVYASQVGTLVLDDEECVAKVISPNPPNILKPGDVVYAEVQDIRKTMATANVLARDGTKRRIGSETYATIHVSKISPDYTDDITKELRRGDLIRAMVTDVKPSLQLTTKDRHLGVIRSLCGRCKTKLVRKDAGQLSCLKCRRSMPRKIADDYGDVRYEYT